ncbi:MAG: J domain-containing protein [Synergistaceae bacterium]|jgi:curved DNA-binding protein CbpA|nr:J domain-containing protein [Synergistaceae bacterium]
MTGGAHFKVLGLPQDASWDEVKKSFRRLARTYHPDVAGPSSARKFAEITEAYMTLKAAISPEAFSGVTRAGGRAQPRGQAGRKAGAASGRASLFKVFWNGLLQRLRRRHRPGCGENAGADEVSTARTRFIGSVISRAESQMCEILSMRGEFSERDRTSAIVRRLGSRRPEVVILALKRVSRRNQSDDVSRAIIENIKRGMPTTEILGIVLEIFSCFTEPSGRSSLARAIIPNANKFSDADAVTILKYFKRWKLEPECNAAFLSHDSENVVATALHCWPAESGAGGARGLLNLLKRDDERILVPLLRLLRREKMPPWALLRLSGLMRDSASPAVRVWASAIVRDQNVS